MAPLVRSILPTNPVKRDFQSEGTSNFWFQPLVFAAIINPALVSSSVVVMPSLEAAALIVSLSDGVSRSSTASDLMRLRRSSSAEAAGISRSKLLF